MSSPLPTEVWLDPRDGVVVLSLPDATPHHPDAKYLGIWFSEKSTHTMTLADKSEAWLKLAPTDAKSKANTCAAMEGATGIDCEQPAGHQGDHSGTREPKAENDSIGYRLFVCWPRNEFDGKRVVPPAVSGD